MDVKYFLEELPNVRNMCITLSVYPQVYLCLHGRNRSNECNTQLLICCIPQIFCCYATNQNILILPWALVCAPYHWSCESWSRESWFDLV